jgi:hypothetical protein
MNTIVSFLCTYLEVTAIVLRLNFSLYCFNVFFDFFIDLSMDFGKKAGDSTPGGGKRYRSQCTDGKKI